MTATLIDEVPINVADDLTRAREVVATARSDAHVALIAHTALLTVETLAQQVERAERALAKDRNDWAEWVQFAIDRSREVADEHEWCPVYDATMERLGFPPRPEPEPEEVDVDWYTTVTLSKNIDEDEILRLVRDEVGSDGRNLEVSQAAVVTVDVRIGGSYTTTEGSCVCDDIDSDVINDYLPDWTGDWEIDSNGTVNCDNG